MINKKGQEVNQKISTCLSSKKGQEVKSKENKRFSYCPFNKKGQEEMIGFGLIVVLVTVIIVILIAIIMYKSDKSSSVNSYEVESFVSALLTYTTDCSESYQEHLSVQRVIARCVDKKVCDNGKNSCDLLKEVLAKAIEDSWNTNQRPVKGYVFNIMSDKENPITIQSADNLTGDSRTAVQDLTVSGKDITITLDIYG